MKKNWFALISVVVVSASVLSFQNCGGGFQVLNVDSLGSSGELSFLPGAKKDNPFVCQSRDTISANPIHRLSKIQLQNTLASVVGKATQQAVANQINTLFDDSLKKDLTDFSNSITDSQMSAYQAIAEAVQAQLRANPTVAQDIGGTCLSAATVTSACRDDAIQKVGTKAFRRPLSPAEITRLNQAFALGANGIEGLALTVYTLILSPNFLLHLELGDATSTAAGTFDLTPYEVAARISYGLTDGPPDATLYAAAVANQLSTVSQVRPHVERLILTAEAKEKIHRFVKYWLDPRRYSGANLAPDFLQGLDVAGVSALNDEFEREMYEYVDYVVFDKKGTFDDLVLGRESFARTPAAAAIYGHAAVTGNSPATVDPVRKGLFMRTPLLAGDGNETHPIIRGVKVRSRLLCETLGLPVGVMTNDPTFFSDAARTRLSTRDRTAGITAGASCMGCHASINPVGFAFENFDTLGRVRMKETAFSTTNMKLAEHAIVTSSDGVRLGGDPLPIRDGLDVIDGMSRQNQLAGCFVRQVSRFYRIQKETVDDACFLNEIYQKSMITTNTPVIDVFKTQYLQPTLFKRRM